MSAPTTQRLTSFNCAIGTFGTLISINMLKTFALTCYVPRKSATTIQARR